MTEDQAFSDQPRRRKWRWLLLPILLLILLPWLLAKTPLRNRLLSAIVGSEDVSVQSRDASFGYFTPLSLSGLRIESAAQAAVVQVEQIESEHSWLGLLFAGSDLGTFRFDQPHFDVLVRPSQTPPEADAVASPEPEPIDLPQLVAEVRDASVIVRTPGATEPPIDVDNIDVTFRVENEGEKHYLRIDPTTIFDQQPLTPQLCGQGLQLVAPLLADELSAEGAFSLRFSEVQIPLGAGGDRTEDLRIAGEVELHQASVALKNTAARRLIALIAELADRSMPERVTVAEGVRVEFRVVDGRVQHEGLAFVLPLGDSSIQIKSSGSVGLDESLALQVAVQLPEDLVGQSKLIRRLAGKPLTLAIGGTFDEPEIGLADQPQWSEMLEGLLTGDEGDPDAEPLGDILGGVVGGLLQRAAEREPRPRDGQPQDRPGLLRRMLQGEPEPESGAESEPDSTIEPDSAIESGEGSERRFPRLRERLRTRRSPAPTPTPL